MSEDAQREFAAGSGQIAGLGPRDGWPYPQQEWHRVSAKYAWIDLVTNLLAVLVLVLVLLAQLVSNFRLPLFLNILLPVLCVGGLIAAALAFRRTRAIGYMLRTDDFIYRRGLLFHRVVAVPYGRLQLVDVQEGPLLRMFGLASLKFVTAAAGSNVQLPGLEKAVAEQLRDQLIAIAESRRSGL